MKTRNKINEQSNPPNLDTLSSQINYQHQMTGSFAVTTCFLLCMFNELVIAVSCLSFSGSLLLPTSILGASFYYVYFVISIIACTFSVYICANARALVHISQKTTTPEQRGDLIHYLSERFSFNTENDNTILLVGSGDSFVDALYKLSLHAKFRGLYQQFFLTDMSILGDFFEYHIYTQSHSMYIKSFTQSFSYYATYLLVSLCVLDLLVLVICYRYFQDLFGFMLLSLAALKLFTCAFMFLALKFKSRRLTRR